MKLSTLTRLAAAALLLSPAAMAQSEKVSKDGPAVQAANRISVVPPANDNFANATPITMAGLQTLSSTVDATLEPGEPTIPAACGVDNTGHSVWFTFTGTGGTLTFDTADSAQVPTSASTGPVDTIMSIYSGTTLAGLTQVACNDDRAGGVPPDFTSLISNLPTVSGRTYYVRVSSFNGGSPPTDRSLGEVRLTVTGSFTTVTGPTLLANATTLNFGTATPVGTASTAQTVTLTNTGTAATTITSITVSGAPFTVNQTGTTLTLAPGATTTFTVTFTPTDATAATGTVTIVSNAPTSPLVINLTGTGFVPPTAPANDNRVNATVLTGTSGSLTGTNVAATLEPGEPVAACQTLNNNSVWWTYTPTQGGLLSVDLSATTFDTVLSFYQPGTTQIGCDDDGSTGPNGLASVLTDIPVIAGSPVLIRVAGFGSPTTVRTGAISGTFSFIGTTAGEGAADAARTFLSATPNPVRGASAVRFGTATAQDVTVAVYDVTGRQVATLFQGAVAADQQMEVSLNAASLPSGVYVVRATGTDLNLTQRVTVVR